MAVIKLVNKNRQTIRTQLYKYGKVGKAEVELALPPRSESVAFDEELLTPIAKDQIRRKILKKQTVVT